MKYAAKSRQAGFGVAGLLIIVVALIGVGAIGYFMYKKGQDSKAAQQPANQSAVKKTDAVAAPTSASAGQNDLMLDSWGVHAPYEASVKLNVKSITSEKAMITSDQFLARNIDCLGGVAAVIDRYAPDEYVTENRQKSTPTDRTAADIFTNANLDVAKLYKAGGYYYLYRTAEGPCDVSAQMANDPTANAVKTAVSKLEVIQKKP